MYVGHAETKYRKLILSVLVYLESSHLSAKVSIERDRTIIPLLLSLKFNSHRKKTKYCLRNPYKMIEIDAELLSDRQTDVAGICWYSERQRHSLPLLRIASAADLLLLIPSAFCLF